MQQRPLHESIFSRKKKQRVRFTKALKTKIVEMASQQETVTFSMVKREFDGDDDRLRIIHGLILKRRKELADEISRTDPNRQVKGIHRESSGYVYIVENSAFCGWIKVGMTTNVQSRLNAYNGYDPLRRFVVVASAKVPDRRRVESLLLHSFGMKSSIQNSEWFKISKQDAIEIFCSVTSSRDKAHPVAVDA